MGVAVGGDACTCVCVVVGGRRVVQVAEFPTELCPEFCGKGIGMWQLPNQISPTLLFLNQFKIRSYLEVGCAAGGTFMFTTELLRKSNALQGATCVDVAPPGENTHSSTDENRGSPFFGILHEYLKQHSEYASFFVGTSVAYAEKHPGGPVGGAAPTSVSDGVCACADVMDWTSTKCCSLLVYICQVCNDTPLLPHLPASCMDVVGRPPTCVHRW